MKIVINSKHGGFDMSEEGLAMYNQLASKTFKYADSIPRDCPHLVEVLMTLGTGADNVFSSLKIVEVPDDVEWFISEYDGKEWVSEVHRTWEQKK